MDVTLHIQVVGRPESHGPEDVWKRMYEDAQSLVDEMPVAGPATLPAGEHEPGFVLAYGVYPKAVAHSYVCVCVRVALRSPPLVQDDWALLPSRGLALRPGTQSRG